MVVPFPHLLAVIVLGGASRIVIDASAAAPPPPTAEVVVDDHDKRRRRLRAPLDNRTISFACFVSIVADYDDDYDGEGNDGEVPGIDDDRRTSTHPVVWCDVRGLPPGRNVTAEIRDGGCESFVDVASSGYYTSGMASPFYLPMLSDEDMAMGVFDHEYCCRVDVLSSSTHDDAEDDEGGGATGGGGGEAVSVLSGRHDMDVTYNYREEVDVDRNDHDEDERGVDYNMEEVEVVEEEEEEESGAKAVEEVLSSVYLTDENTRSKKATEDLTIALAVLAGAVVTMALVAIIYGGGRIKKRGGGDTGLSSSLRRRGRHGRRLPDDDADFSDAEAEEDTEDENNVMVPPMRKENEIV
jgi:hypothetical protein